VLTSPLSAFATSLAISRAGGIPVFVDVDERGLLDLRLSRALLERDPTLRFVVPVHLYGRPLDLIALDELRSDCHVTIVEDCAQSIGASWKGRPTGSVGAAAATSFYPTKNLGALGDGGCLLTSDEAIAERARSLRHYGQEGVYRHTRLGMNSRLDEVHAALLRDVLLPRLDEWTARRRLTAERYLRRVRNPRLHLPVEPAEAQACWHLFPVLVEGASRSDFTDHLSRHGVASGIHYPTLIPDQPAWSDGARFEVVGQLDQAARFARTEVSLPIHPLLKEEEAEAVIDACNAWAPT
jgi:dTDP-3-amino-3,4,6-trideoxy-alpha-D-glucose transaminase